MVVNEGGHGLSSIRRVRALFIDSDVYAHKGKPLDEVEWHQLPTFIVVREPNVSWQAYWLLAEGFSSEQFTLVQKRLAAHYGTDPSVSDLPRIMRVPGFIHQKDASNPQEVALLDPLPYASGADREALLRAAGLIYDPEKVAVGLAELSSKNHHDRNEFKVASSREIQQRPISIREARHILGFIDPNFGNDYCKWAGMVRALMSDPGVTPLRGENGELLEAGDLEREALVNEWCSGELWRSRTGDHKFEVTTYRGWEHIEKEIAKHARGDGPKISWGTFFHDARNNPDWVVLGRQGLPTICLGTPINQILEILDAALAHAVCYKGEATEPVIFRQSSRLVVIDEAVGELVCGADGESCTVRRARGAPLLKTVDPERLRLIASLHVRFLRWDARCSDWVDTDCPLTIARAYLAKGDWGLPVLEGIAESPTLRLDGSILQDQGYDDVSGLVVRFKSAFPPIPDKPTREQAKLALEILRGPVRGMEFRDVGDKDVFVAAALTGVTRHAIDLAPLFIFSASKAGSGKTIMAQAVAKIVTGHGSTMMTLTPNEQENEKRLDAALLKGDRVIVFDNCDRPICGNALCQVITNPTRNARVLGESRNVLVSTKILMIATGNNLRVQGDMAKRALLSYNDPDTEFPENRRFDFDLLEEVRRNRPEIVVAALTLITAYLAARTSMQVEPTRFPQWDRLVRFPIIWAGGCDIAENMKAVLEDDPDRLAVGAVLEAWANCYGSREKRLSEVVNDLSGFQLDAPKQALNYSLKEALDARTGAGVEAKQLGEWLATRENRVVNGLKFQKSTGRTGGSRRWSVVKTNEDL